MTDETERSLGRIEQKLDNALVMFERAEEVHTKRLNAHTIRIDSLESTRDKQKGYAKAGAALMAMVAVVMGAVFGR